MQVEEAIAAQPSMDSTSMTDALASLAYLDDSRPLDAKLAEMLPPEIKARPHYGQLVKVVLS